MARIRFHHYAWLVSAYGLVNVLDGAFVRATMSGDGCGAHWPNCGGQLIPQTARLATWIEFSHRGVTVLLTVLVCALLFWAFRAFPKRHPVRVSAVAALLLVFAEAAIGAGLVLFRWVAHNDSIYRAIAMPTHLVTTFFLIASLTLTAWWASGHPAPRLRGQGAMPWALALGLLATLILGVSGAITALGDTLFPAASLSEGFRQDFNPSAPFLIGLRIYHPLISLSAGLYLTLIAGLAITLRPSADVKKMARGMLLIFLAQMGAGLLNLVLLAPVWMQLAHLLLADIFWISLVLMSAAAVAVDVPQVELASIAGALPEGGIRPATWRDYVALTKPRVISLLLLTTLAAMLIAVGQNPGPGPWLYLAVGLGLYMSAGAANAINMVLERDLDFRMGRTAKRPTVTHTVPPRAALQFSLALSVGSFALLWFAANLLCAMLALAGLAFYVIVYTLLLKRRTWYNIVIGGAAGAFPPLVGWSAVTHNLSPLAWCLFGIIFLWTPVHFWALAIMIRDDYARAGVPMLPVVKGLKATVSQIAVYAVLTVALSALPLLLPGQDGHSSMGRVYLGAAVLLNAVLLVRSARLYRCPERPQASSLFHYSMLYLALLFLAMAVDRAHLI